MSSIDLMIAKDLAALGEDSRRDLAGIDDMRTTNMYRDERAGAEARRDALANERRRELAMMPLALSHVFAHRVGRAAAGVAAAACASLLLLMVTDPLLFELAGWLVPGLDLFTMGALAGLTVVVAYVIATHLAEGWFARRMHAAIHVGDDPHRDIDALARGPVEIANDAVRRVDGLAIGFGLAGFTALVIAFGYIAVIATAWLGASSPQPVAAMAATLLRGALARDAGLLVAFATNASFLVAALLATSTVTFFIVRGCRRDGRSPLVAMLGHPATLVLAVAGGLATAYAYTRVLLMLDARGDLPTIEIRVILAGGSTLAFFVVIAWTLLWWRRRELSRIE